MSGQSWAECNKSSGDARADAQSLQSPCVTPMKRRHPARCRSVGVDQAMEGNENGSAQPSQMSFEPLLRTSLGALATITSLSSNRREHPTLLAWLHPVPDVPAVPALLIDVPMRRKGGEASRLGSQGLCMEASWNNLKMRAERPVRSGSMPESKPRVQLEVSRSSPSHSDSCHNVANSCSVKSA